MANEREKFVQDYLEWMEKDGTLDGGTLDSLVDDLKSNEAMEINNRGTEVQLGYIFDKFGPKAREELDDYLS